MVIVLKDCYIVYINDLNNKELVTLTKCIFTSGYYIPLIITFKGAYYLCKYFDNNLNGDVL